MMVVKRLSQLALVTIFLASNVSMAEALVGPSGLTAAPYLNNQILLRWNAGDSGTIFYRVEQSLSATGSFVVIGLSGSSETGYLVSGLAAGTTYYYRVSGMSGTNVSTYSNVASATAAGGVTSTTTVPTTSTTSTTLAQARGPVANAGPDQLTQTLTTITFNGSASDPSGTITSYAWSFGDGGTASGPSATHAYSTPGTYTAALTVTDNTGARASDTAMVSVADRAPVANAGPDQTSNVGSTVTFTGSGSDLDGRVVSYSWSFGDSTSASGATATHKYASAGSYTAVLTVTDDRGAQGTDRALVSVTGSATGPTPFARRFGGRANDYPGHQIAVDVSGNVFMTGRVDAVADFGGGVTCPGAAAPVVKLGPAGDLLWVRCLADGWVGGATGTAVAADHSGNVIVTGSFTGRVDFGGGPLAAVGSDDIFVAKYSPTGTHLWSRRFGGTSWGTGETGSGLAVDAAGNVIVTGNYGEAADFGDGPAPSLDAGFFILKLTPAGSHVWSTRVSRGGSRAIALDPSGNVVIAGGFTFAINFGVAQATCGWGACVFVAKYSPAGTPMWAKTGGASGSLGDSGSTVAADAAGNIVLAGRFGTFLNFGTGSIRSSGGDIFLAKFAPSGTLTWLKTFRPGSGDAVAIGAGGNILLTGSAGWGVDFGGGALNSGSGLYLAKFSPDGAHLSSQLFTGAAGSAMVVDASGAMMVGGVVFASVDLGSGPLTSAGGFDFLVFRRPQ